MLQGTLYDAPASAPLRRRPVRPALLSRLRRVATLTGVEGADAPGLDPSRRGSVSLACLFGQLLAAGLILAQAPRGGLGLDPPGVRLPADRARGLGRDGPARHLGRAARRPGDAGEPGIRPRRAAEARRRPSGWRCRSSPSSSRRLTKQNGVEAGLYALPGAAIVLGWRRSALACAPGGGAGLAPGRAAFWGLGTPSAIKANLVDGLNNGVNPLSALHLAYVPYLKSCRRSSRRGCSPRSPPGRGWPGGRRAGRPTVRPTRPS